MQYPFSKEYNIIKYYPILIITIPIAMVVLIFFAIIWPFFKVRFGLISCDRIGHFAANTELYLCNKIYNKCNALDLFYFPKEVANTQLEKMVKRKIIILPKFIIRPLDLICRKFYFLKNHRAITTSYGDYDINNLLDKMPAQIKMNTAETKYGKKILKNMGIPKGSKFICLIVRDNSYIEKRWSNKGTMNFHSHRNIDINDFRKASVELANKGYYVLRMGSIVKGNFLFPKNNMIIDYANSSFQSDFMDIFLMSHCYFCISTVTGLDAVSFIARKPILFVSSIPIGMYSTSSKKFMNCTRNHFSIQKKTNLTTSEIFNNNLAFALDKKNFDKKKIILKSYSSADLKKIVIEMNEYVKNHFKYKNKSNKNLNDQYWKLYETLYKSHKLDYNLHGSFKSSYSCFFLKKFRNHLK
jgi:putative glycosyltransferase (TIGR04372 family)